MASGGGHMYVIVDRYEVPFKDLIGVIHVFDPRPEKNGEELRYALIGWSGFMRSHGFGVGDYCYFGFVKAKCMFILIRVN
ncbi:putative DNA-binding pseudobarrel domain superfamily [Helianthus debilis subsp. tardiflorus]